MKRRLLRYWTYFRRGHSTYMALGISLANALVIQYRLLIQYITILDNIFPDMLTFALTFLILYTPTAVIIGWLDYKRMAVPMDLSLLAKSNPFSRDLAQAIIHIANGEMEKAKKVMEKWT